ncbi:hypothetical protein AYI70_g5273 [Smittium culicis]|uniref:Uncharacterized protein n=1 Tax=Smittium culicis TaxID=133412 RepID=A0A1R1XVF1_9FUNG|nr:hypothetical protein AYI70_g9054 [Smittium culicis]OMJ18588.1 hypothetical protein AYI70_g5273 [Smittium culicis]
MLTSPPLFALHFPPIFGTNYEEEYDSQSQEPRHSYDFVLLTEAKTKDPTLSDKLKNTEKCRTNIEFDLEGPNPTISGIADFIIISIQYSLPCLNLKISLDMI